MSHFSLHEVEPPLHEVEPRGSTSVHNLGSVKMVKPLYDDAGVLERMIRFKVRPLA